MQIPKVIRMHDRLDLIESLVASSFEYVKSGPNPYAPSEDELDQIQPSGGAFVIPVVVPVMSATGDERIFEPDSLSTRNLPVPLLWQEKTASGHDSSVVIGRIDSVEVDSDGIKNARGVFDTNPYAREAERMIRSGFLRGISADLDKFSATEEADHPKTLANAKEPKKIKNKTLKIDEARLMGVTVVPMPAFQECIIMMEDQYTDLVSTPLPDGEYVDGLPDTYSEESLVASAAPIAPPREWFQRYNTNKPMPLTVDDNGRVYGYLALWESTHIGVAGQVRPPRNVSNYKFFRTGVVRTAEGVDVTTGSLTLTGGHAPLNASAQSAIKHYDDTSSAVVDVVAGEDQFGIWLAGALRPTVTPEQVRALRASALSGDWRPINGRLELVRACFVNTPGFMTTRAMVASGQVTSLVAAGTGTLERMRIERLAGVSDLNERLSAIEAMENERKLSALRSRMGDRVAEFRIKEREALNAQAEALRARLSR